MQQRPPQICKYGQNCNRFAQGTCKFLHPNQPSQGQGGKMGGYNTNPNPNFGKFHGPGNQYNNNPNQNQGNFNEGIGGGWGSQHGNYGKPSYPPNMNPNYKNPNYNDPNYKNQNYTNPNIPPKGDEFTSKFCMSFQFNQPCKF